MTIMVEIKPDNATDPGWLSNAIRVRDRAETNLVGQIGSHINPTKGGFYRVYVRVYNTGTEAIGSCCETVGVWASGGNTPTITNLAAGQSQASPNGGLNTVVCSNVGGVLVLRLQTPAGGLVVQKDFRQDRTQWGWSPDGAWFVYAALDQKSNVTSAAVHAAGDFEQANGAVIRAGTLVATPPTGLPGVWGWSSSSSCLVCVTPSPGAGAPKFDIFSFRSFNGNNAATGPGPNHAGTWVVSPCGDTLALVPQAGFSPVTWFNLADQVKQLTLLVRSDNTVGAANRTITSTGLGNNGIALTGFSDPNINNMDCATGGIAEVELRRLEASTVPLGTVQYPPVGVAMPPGTYRWVEIPGVAFPAPSSGGNHYCLLAKAQVENRAPAAWNEAQGPKRAQFAQRNIVFA
jgi:hypothetical protein